MRNKDPGRKYCFFLPGSHNQKIMKNIYGKKVNKAVKQYVPKSKSSFSWAIDLGCGNGANSNYVAKLNYKVYAFDIDKNVFENKLLRRENIYVAVKNIKDISGFNKNDASLILALNILQFLSIDEIKEFFPKMCSWLKPNGMLIVQMFDSPVVDWINEKIVDFKVLDYRKWIQKDFKPKYHTHNFVRWVLIKK